MGHTVHRTTNENMPQIGNTVDTRYLEVEGTSETHRDIRTSIYQIFRTEKIQIEQQNFTNEYVIRLL